MSLILGSDKKGSIFDDRRKEKRRKENVEVSEDKRKSDRRKKDQKIINK